MTDENDKSGLSRRMQMRSVERGVAKSQDNTKKRLKDYGEVLIEYLRENGQLICITDDKPFIESLRDLVVNTLKMPASCLNITAKAEMTGKLCRQTVEAKKTPVILIEQTVGAHELTFTAKLLKTAYPEVKILMLIQETDKNHLALLHESGVDAFIIKPLDSPTLLEKIALAIKPSEQVDRALEWAKTLINQGEYLRALQICTQTLEQQNNSTAVLLLMGDIFKAMKEYDKAVETYQKASTGSALYLEPLRKMAELYAEKGNPIKQLEYLEKMDEVSPLNLERKIQIGELALKLNRSDKARKIFDQVMKLSNRQAKESISTVAYRVADIYTDLDPVMAASFLQRGLEARKEFWSRDDVPAFNRLGLLLRRAGKWREAVDEYLKAISVAPNDDSLHYNISMAYMEGKDNEGARASALKALALNPELPKRSARIAANLAAVFLNTNDKMHALPLLRQALDQDPNNALARELLAKADA